MSTLTQSNARKLFDPLTVPRLPARLDAEQTARILGFSRDDIPVLVKAKLLQPLGKPRPSAVKYFSAAALEEVRSDQSWLDAATKAVSQYWRFKNERRNANHESLTNPAA